MKRFLRIGLLCTACIPAAPAWAQSSDDGETGSASREIIVTATRRAESLQDVPLAVTALDSQALADKGINNIGALAQSVAPGVNITQFAGTPSTLAFNIRGAYASDPGVGLAEQGVALYQDGIPIGRAQGTGIELGDIERIELLRGPQGTLFGRNAEGGAVQFVTKRPSGEFGGSVEGSVYSFDGRKILGILNLPEFGGFALKLSGLIDRHGGYTKNLDPRDGVDFAPATGALLPTSSFVQKDSGNYEDLGLKDQKAFRVSAEFTPSDSFTAYYTYDHSDLEYTVSYNSRTGGRVPSSYAFCAIPDFAAVCASPESIIANVYYGTPGEQPINPKYTDLPLYTPRSSSFVRGHGLTLEYELSPQVTLKSITGFRKLRENGFTNLGTSQVFVQFIPTAVFPFAQGQMGGVTGTLAPALIRQKQKSQELQLLGTFGDLDLTMGGFYFNEKVDDTRSSFFSIGYFIDGDQLVPQTLPPFDLGGVGPDGLTASLQRFQAEAKSYAAYAQGTWTPSGIADGNLSLTAGLRYTNDKKDFERVRAAVGAGGANESSFRHDRIDPAFSVAYQATPDLNIYARWARAYRAGGTGIRNKLALTTYEPEVNTTQELGLKSMLFDRHLRFNVAAFLSQIKNSQVSFQNSSVDPSSTNVINAQGKIKIKGVEVEAQAYLTDALSMNVGYSFMDANVGNAVVSGLVSDGLGGTSILTQPIIRAPFLPKHQLIVGADFNQPLGAGDMRFVMHAEYSLQTSVYNEPREIPLTRNAGNSLHTLNGRIGIRDIGLGMAKLSLEAFGNNLLDKKEFAYAYTIGASDFTVGLRNDPGGSGYAQPPRTLGLMAKVEF